MIESRFLCKTKKYGITITFGVIVMLLLFITSCKETENEVVDVSFDPETTYIMRTTDVVSLVSDSGITRYRLNAKLWLTYDKAAEPYWYFPQAIYIEKFDSTFQTVASIKADTAYFWTKKELGKLIGNVEVENLEGDHFYTSELFWNQKTEKIYTSKSVLIIDKEGKESIASNGFESNQDMTAYKFYNAKTDLGEYQEKEAVPDSTALPVDSAKIQKP